MSSLLELLGLTIKHTVRTNYLVNEYAIITLIGPVRPRIKDVKHRVRVNSLLGLAWPVIGRSCSYVLDFLNPLAQVINGLLSVARSQMESSR